MQTPIRSRLAADLQEVLEGWIILGLRLGHEMPIVEGIKLTVEEEAVC